MDNGMTGAVAKARMLAIQAAARGTLADGKLTAALAAYDAAKLAGAPTHEQEAALLDTLNQAVAYLGPEAFLRATAPGRYRLLVALRRLTLIGGALCLILLATYASTVVSIAGRIVEDVKAFDGKDPYAQALEAMAKSPDMGVEARMRLVHDLREAESTYAVIVRQHDRMTTFGSYLFPFLKTTTLPITPVALDGETARVLAEAKDGGKGLSLARAAAIDPGAAFLRTVKQYGNAAASYLDLFGRWMLPVVCGLLGGLVYVMRLMLNPDLDVDVKDGAIRILAGGIAGLVVGWFMAPGAAPSSEIAAVSATPFGLAFFAGFSIDVLFAMLDRAKRALVDPPPPAS